MSLIENDYENTSAGPAVEQCHLYEACFPGFEQPSLIGRTSSAKSQDLLPALFIESGEQGPQLAVQDRQGGLDQLLIQLDSSNFRTREQATRTLSQEGLGALDTLLRAQGGTSTRSLEATRRIESLTNQLFEREGPAALGRILASLGSSDMQLQAGAQRVFDRLSTASILDIAGSQNSNIDMTALGTALQRQNDDWSESVSPFVGQGSAESDQSLRRGIAAAELLGRRTDGFNLSLAYGMSLLRNGDEAGSSRALGRGLDSLDRLLREANNDTGILHAIDFRQQLNDHMTQNELPANARGSFNQLLERALDLENRFRLLPQDRRRGVDPITERPPAPKP